MPYLFCEPHGQEHEATSLEEQENYRLLGEAVLIVSGALNSGSWYCDRCQTRLKKGQTAYLMTAFPNHFAEEFDRYDYAYERQYFQIDRAKARIYGAAPPGGIPDPATLRKGR
jgi:hypothetical protein